MQRVAEIMAPVLGWTDAQAAREVEVYRSRVEAERRSQTEPDDISAEKMRLEAPEVRDLITSPVA
jgi:glycerol-3-phosphate dehydrogenase